MLLSYERKLQDKLIAMPIIIKPIIDHPELISVVADWLKSYWGSRFPDRTQKEWENTILTNENQLPFTLIAI
ncbi:MAG: hypothetical protein NTU49_04225, partial [Gammaproteobacteria bacterium]|nr:hypothetical protein [Gammaproteobacteria bacterium]